MTVCLFPDPVPEQLLRDTCARYKALMGYDTDRAVTRDLFGLDKKFIPPYDFPTRLNNLYENLPQGHRNSQDEWIDNNSLYDYYGPFVEMETAQEVRTNMKTGRGTTRPGNIRGVKKPFLLKSCSCCAQEDQAEYCYPVLRRLPQIPGVIVCPKHRTWLSVSSMELDNSSGYHMSAEVFGGVAQSAPLDLTDPRAIICLNIAEDAQWLLEQKNLQIGPLELANRYRIALSKAGFGHEDRLQLQMIAQEFLNFYTERLLDDLGCFLIDTHSGWLVGLLSGRVSVNPIYHLLLIRFLGVSAPEFLSPICPQQFQSPGPSPSSIQSLGNGPWPCYNPVAAHSYKAATITEYEIERIRINERQSRIYIAHFKCSCGFEYSRPLDSPYAGNKVPQRYVRTHGDGWDGRFIQAWNDPNVSWYGLLETFKLGLIEAVSEARRLSLALILDWRVRGNWQGRNIKVWIQQNLRVFWQRYISNNASLTTENLETTLTSEYQFMVNFDKDWFDQLLGSSKSANTNKSTEGTNKRQKYMKKKRMYRAALRRVIKVEPKLTRAQFKRDFRVIHNWLVRYDSKWYGKLLPGKTPGGRGYSDEQIAEIDTAIALQLPDAAKAIKSDSGTYRRQVTKTSLLDHIKKRSTYGRFKEHLPQTKRLIDELAETNTSFAVRRVWQTAEKYRQELICPSRSQFYVKAGLAPHHLKTLEIREAINKAYNWLSSGN
jgi:hypothetical protein